jgi:hypothetical protein
MKFKKRPILVDVSLFSSIRIKIIITSKWHRFNIHLRAVLMGQIAVSYKIVPQGPKGRDKFCQRLTPYLLAVRF